MKLSIRIRAPFACFTNPATRTDRRSNVVPSHGACRGMISSVCNKPALGLSVVRYIMLSVPRTMSMTRNEIKDFGTGKNPIYVEDRRTQRTTTYLLDLDAIVEFDVGIIQGAARGDDSVEKLFAIVQRRVIKGQFYRGQPYAGQRELPLEMDYVEDISAFKPVDYNADLGLTYFDCDWQDSKQPRYFITQEIKGGVLLFPTWEYVRKNGLKLES